MDYDVVAMTIIGCCTRLKLVMPMMIGGMTAGTEVAITPKFIYIKLLRYAAVDRGLRRSNLRAAAAGSRLADKCQDPRLGRRGRPIYSEKGSTAGG